MLLNLSHRKTLGFLYLCVEKGFHITTAHHSCISKELYCIYTVTIVFCSLYNFPTVGQVAE